MKGRHDKREAQEKHDTVILGGALELMDVKN